VTLGETGARDQTPIGTRPQPDGTPLGLPGSWHWNKEIKGHVVDAVNYQARLIVKVDRLTHHTSPEQCTRDRKHVPTLTLAGWRILRFTHQELTGDLLTVLNTIQTSVNRT
jgi:very-short-patch-repair endonuclease